MDYLANTELFRVEQEIAALLHDVSDEDLRSFAELHEDPNSDAQIELYIFTYFILFTRKLSIEDLEQAIQRMEGWVVATSPDNPDRTRRFQILDMMSAIMCQLLASQSSVIDKVDNKIMRQCNQAIYLTNNYERTGTMKDLHEAISIMEQVIGIIPQDSIGLPKMLSDFGQMLGMRFERTGSMDDLNRAVNTAEMAVDATPQNHPDRVMYLNNLGIRLGTRFKRTGLIDDLKRAINVTSITVDATPQDHPDRAMYLNNLGTLLRMRFERTGLADDLKHAMHITDIAVDATPQNHPDRAICLNNLGNLLGRRFEQTGSMDDLNRAVDVADMAVDATPRDHPNRAGRLNNLGNWLDARFKRTGLIADLNRAVDVADIAVDTTPQDHPNRAMFLYNLGSWLGTRFERTGSMDDLNRALRVADMAVDATPQDNPDRAGRLDGLGNWLGTRHERTGSMDDLQRAVHIADMAVDATPQDHPDRAGYLNNLGRWLGTRFELTGSMDDLNRAVDVANMAVDATPQDHADRADRLNSLGSWLGRRFEQTELMDDLNRAVYVTNMAVDTTPQKHFYRAGYLNNLGGWLIRRFERTGSMDDINCAVDVADMAVDDAPQDHPNRAMYLLNLGVCLSGRFERTGLIDDLNRALDVTNMAIDALPQGHPNRAIILNSLGSCLGMRFKRTELMDDLNRAVNVTDMAVDATPQDHPNRAAILNNLGNLLSTRFERTGLMDDLNRALSCFKNGWSCYSSPPSMRIRMAQSAANILASQQNWDESCNFLRGAIELLPIASQRLLDNNDKQYILAQFGGLASMAAAISLKAGKNAQYALKLLELGRCVIASLLLEMRTDLSELKEQYPKLAAKFESLRNELDTPSRAEALISVVAPWKSQSNRRFKADQEFSMIITEIRSQPGFQNFLLPPTYNELIAAANQGPIIIINISRYRCDAFLVEHHRIRALPLPNLREEELKEKAQQLSVGSLPILQWLWDVAAGPVLDALGYQCLPLKNSCLPRVWWIPTGVLSHFPIHAAGYHAKGSGNTVLDRVMSSYGSSVKALVYGRQHSARRAAESASGQALLVAMQQTLKHSTLPFATQEVDMLAKLCPSLQLKVVMPLRRKEEVLAHLQVCKIFHFAGHGRSDPLDPSRSCLLLDDWKENPLTVGDLREFNIQKSSPFLGYLSACSTSANKVNNLVDEAIHLASAFQLAGFQHVIGTLWEVSDSHCVDVARVMYETLRDEGMTDMAVCRGLHRAVKALRDGRIESMEETRNAELCDEEVGNGELCDKDCKDILSPLYWAPYIHFGN